MAPRSAAQFEEMREETRGRILAGALAAFARLGYERATVRDIAREAGISQGLMYSHFRSKHELLHAIFQRGMRDVEASLGAAPPGTPPREALELLVRGSFQTVRSHLSFWKLTYALRFQPEVLEGLADGLRSWTDSVVRELEARLDAAGVSDAAVAARVLFATIDGVAQHFALDPEGYPLTEVAGEVVRRFSPAGGAGGPR